jgi:hypothetical protein
MTAQSCAFEQQVLQAVECRGLRDIGPELESHVASCSVCSDLAAVVAAFEGAREDALAEADLPDAGRVWRRSQMRAREEAIRTAGRPITAVQVIAFGAATGLIGACLGATSTGFQAFLQWAAAVWAGLDLSAWLSAAGAYIVANAPFVAALALAVVLLPAVVYFAIERE